MVEYEIHPVGYEIEVHGPWSQWLHYRLMAFPGCKFDKELKTWRIAKCREHLVAIVIRTYLNNLSKVDPEFRANQEEQ